MARITAREARTIAAREVAEELGIPSEDGAGWEWSSTSVRLNSRAGATVYEIDITWKEPYRGFFRGGGGRVFTRIAEIDAKTGDLVGIYENEDQDNDDDEDNEGKDIVIAAHKGRCQSCGAEAIVRTWQSGRITDFCQNCGDQDID